MAVLTHRAAEALLRLADPVLDRVLVQHQLFGGRLVTAPALQEDQQGLTQANVVLVVVGQARQRAEHPWAQQRGQRRAALRPPARVFQGRGRSLHGAQVDLVLHDLQASADVAVHARGEQREHRLVVA
jgi:hypothetical protein